jgi:hypothetical protein
LRRRRSGRRHDGRILRRRPVAEHDTPGDRVPESDANSDAEEDDDNREHGSNGGPAASCRKRRLNRSEDGDPGTARTRDHDRLRLLGEEVVGEVFE